MQKLVLIAVVVLTCMPALLYAAGRGRGGKSGGEHGDREGHHRNCGQWVDGPCTPSNNATCGAGHQTKTRTGENCPLKEKTAKCHVPCPTPAAGEATTLAAAAGAPAGRAGRGRKASKRCEYIKSEWSECDTTNNQRTRTFTLNTASGEQPAHCKQSKTIRKRCPPPSNKNRANRGGGRGEGRNARGN